MMGGWGRGPGWQQSGARVEDFPINFQVAAGHGHISAPTLIGDGSEDLMTPPANVGKMVQEISGARSVVYPDAGHAFHADYRPSFNKADAEASWKEATNWVKTHGA